MTFTDLIPGRRDRKKPRHRADDRIAELTADYEQQLAELRDENVRLHHFKAEADDFFMIQAAYVTGLEDDKRELQQRLADEQGARAVADADVEARDRWVRDLEIKVADLERRLDVRKLAESAVAITQPIPVITPVPLHQAPFATTNPGRVPGSWGVKDDEPEPAA
ncbi:MULTISPECIES: hypothetical protein [Streptomyces]|uniref:Transposase n=1 Tax=Streptomyces dengpaensis TaxID=2049881 RepID=A0ABN5I9R0_9ACTN|nr:MULTISPECIES: hypothetical protein [Streptomyces]AVH59922.1 hypothetical protein C4B68_33775 [Streptomyces dengpaensis]PIB09557.1 hypothetical protein B1C81_10450 [Streptomyces sp. HG99]